MHALLRSLPFLPFLVLACSNQAPTVEEKDPLTENPTDTDQGDDTDMPPGPTVPMPTGGPGGEDSTDDVIEHGERPDCKPTTCEALGFNCGTVEDGCGDSLNCGECPAGHLCGGATPNVCLAPPPCEAASSCAELGWACGVAIDGCGNTFDCAAEGRGCNEFETCIANQDGITICQPGIGGETGCDVCGGLPTCDAAAGLTQLSGRVITPGRTDDNVGNQVGVPNAFVYILTNNDPSILPEFTDGIPEGETACDRCDGQDLGPVLVGATTDALGYFTLEGHVPVSTEFVLVIKVGRFRRAVQMTLPESAACARTELDPVETRLPRSMDDGLGVNIPRVAISTGDIDAMECVFEKMGLGHGEFTAPADGTSPERIHLYGTDGAEMPDGNPPQGDLNNSLERVTSYDMLVFDCQGQGYLNPPPAGALDNIREYVNRGGRMFASHLSYQWICRNGDTPFSADDPVGTGLAPSADFPGCSNGPLQLDESGVGLVSLGRPRANPAKIQNFADWLVNENAAALNPEGAYEFAIVQPRDLAAAVGEHSEEFVYRGDGEIDDEAPPIQQYAFNTPYGSPEDATCGRVAYSGFHVAAGSNQNSPFANAIFPEHCSGDLTPQEKVLLYMLFDLGACVGDPPVPPRCEPIMCSDVGAECGVISDGCGSAVDCGPCPEGQVCGLVEPNKCAACTPRTCDEVEIECGITGDGCGGTLNCECPPGETCGFAVPNKCGSPDDQR